jgi:hypothetical protein
MRRPIEKRKRTGKGQRAKTLTRVIFPAVTLAIREPPLLGEQTSRAADDGGRAGLSQALRRQWSGERAATRRRKIRIT